MEDDNCCVCGEACRSMYMAGIRQANDDIHYYQGHKMCLASINENTNLLGVPCSVYTPYSEGDTEW